MGAEGSIMTAGYCEIDETPHFKILKSEGHELISLYAETPGWESNGIFFLSGLKESIPVPNEFSMEAAYPNPFNPITLIGFKIPSESHVEICIFDLRGQKVSTLVNEYTQPGDYSINWDAKHFASGVYFVHFMASENNITHVTQVQKLMLIK